MSVPRIPGFTADLRQGRLIELWPAPGGDYPAELWPSKYLGMVNPNPTDWLMVSHEFRSPAEQGGMGCVLVEPAYELEAIADTSWVGRDLGESWVDLDDHVHGNGLETTERRVPVEFFVKGQTPLGSELPVVSLSHPFLWYWDAFPVGDEWRYLNRAGREQDLVRIERTAESWTVEVRALEFRTYLEACGRSAVMQMDYTLASDHPDFERVDDEYSCKWAHFRYCAVHHQSVLSTRPASSKLIGQYIVSGTRTVRVPRSSDRKHGVEYPEFTYAVDHQTGQALKHAINPDELGTYYDNDDSKLHYLTPAYFKREVLQPYASEPGKYRLTVNRLSCLNLWGVDMSINTAGLVEVYLGDLGRDIPSDEWGHWLSYNVPPEGNMEEGRFRRDFYNQPASSPDPVGDLRRARQRVAELSERVLGSRLWRPLDGSLRDEFESLIGPLTDDRAALGPALLVLTKAVVDAIDPGVLKSHVSVVEKSDQSLALLQRFVVEWGGDADTVGILRALQAFRSRGGVAHLENSDSGKAAEALGIVGLSNLDSFNSIVVRLTASLIAIGDLIEPRALATDGDGKSAALQT